MKKLDLKQKKQSVSENTLNEKREKLRLLRFSLISGKLKNHRSIRKTKKDIARTLTLLRKE